MADMLGNALSALVSYQRALATTSHNIANADTEGYSRQRVDFATRIPQQMGDLSIGSGVKLSDVRRVYDEFANLQMRNASGSFSQLDNFYQLATQLDNSLSDPELGISAALSRFYDSVQNLADDPASIPSRQLLLSEAESLGGRFAEFSAQLEGLSKEVNARIQSDVNDINDLAQELADINGLVVEAQGKFGAAPNDLLDQRDLALQRLNDLVSIKTVEQDDGATNVFIGNGQSLVLGEESRSMTTTRSPFGSDRVELAMASSPQSPISEVLSGGSLGASLSFRDGLLDTTKNELGRIATALTTSLNQQNGQGLDLDGNLGADIFNTLSPSAIAATGNASGAQLSATIEDISALDGRNLLVQFDGAAWSFRNAANGQQISAWSGSGTAADPFLIDGVSLTLDAPAAAGDRFLVTPTADAAAQVSVIMSNPAQLAAAAPTRSGADGANTGAAQITETRIVDASDPNLSATVAIEFLDANTYQINGSGSFSYSPGAEIVVNGNAVAITGSPIAGDRFYIEANSGASGDNRNMLAMAAVEDSKLLDGGASSVQNAVSGLVGDIAVATRSAELNRDSQENLLRQTRENVEAISGVNLDEEAANLLKYQQAYQAAAQATSIANQLFQSLISSFR